MGSQGSAMSEAETIAPAASASMASTASASTVSGRQAPPATMTIFGASGDLTKRLVMPALYNLVRAGKLPDRFTIIEVDISIRPGRPHAKPSE